MAPATSRLQKDANMDNLAAARLQAAASKLAPSRDRDQSAEKLFQTMTEHSREVLNRLERYSDCTMRTSDGIKFRLSKSSLAEHSTVLGYAPDECSTIFEIMYAFI
jgi:hypothetical protein